jgi:UDP-N-acetylmuramyl pentapeptide synthase
MSLGNGPLGSKILNDSLRASPASTASGLQTLSEIKYTQGRKIAVLAEMGELENPKEEHQRIGRLVAGLKINYLVAIGPMQKNVVIEAIKNGFTKENIFSVNNVNEAANVLKKIIKKDDLIYLKGSLMRHVERVLLILEGKEVGCQTIVCPFYHHCLECQFLKKGFYNRQ